MSLVCDVRLVYDKVFLWYAANNNTANYLKKAQPIVNDKTICIIPNVQCAFSFELSDLSFKL